MGGYTHLVRLGLELLLGHAVGPVVPEDTAHRVWQHHLDVGVHVLQEAACATDGASSAASSYKVTHTRLGLHPDLHQPTNNSLLYTLTALLTATKNSLGR